jgi:hypothetical protein
MNWWAGFLCYTFCFFIFCFIEMGPPNENPDESLLPETVDTRFLCHSFCCDGIGRTPSSFLRPTLFFSRIRVLLPLFLVETERKENNHSIYTHFAFHVLSLSLCLLLLPTYLLLRILYITPFTSCQCSLLRFGVLPTWLLSTNLVCSSMYIPRTGVLAVSASRK